MHKSITCDGEDLVIDKTGQDTVFVKDKRGNTMQLQMLEGVLYGTVYKREVLQQIKYVQLREDDIYLSAYLRTGTHWTFEMVGMLLNGTAETIPKFKGKNQLEFMTSDELSRLPSPRIINTHFKLSRAPTQLREKKCKIIYNLRDPKDVAVSLYWAYMDGGVSGYQGTFQDFLELYYKGTVDSNGMFENLRDAETFFEENPDIPVHFQVYEETMKDPVAQVRALSDFIGLERNDDLCRAIAEKCTFARMKADKDKYSLKVNGKNFFYRKGIVGDWRNWFTEEMLDEYYCVYDEKMAGSRFYERYARTKVDEKTS
ncbi:sulfotransferase 1B1-like [Haliotis asinina]|uniref:sulfotransferase 1B1-like n=1 Tax=Haliotis asinina TaxID=109174 RepID=UPI003531AAE5